MTTVGTKQDAIVQEIEIAASPERVFQALTDPEELKAWWGAEGVYRVTLWTADLRVGGAVA